MKILFPIFRQYKALGFVPYGIGTVATVAQQGGHFCCIQVQKMEESNDSFFERYENTLKNDNYDCVAFGGLSTQYKELKRMLAIGNKYNCHTILGSYLVDSNPELIAKNIGSDYCIVGEGEYSFLELVNALEKGEDISGIKGVINAKSGNFQCIPPVYIENIDEIPFVDVELTHMTEFIKKHHCLPLTLSRSCPYKCTFCYHLEGASYRPKSIDYVFRELDYFFNELGDDIHSLFIMDDCFNVDKKRVKEFCEGIQKYNVPFRIQTRIEYMDEEILIMLKEAGCIRAAYGIESASNKVLKSMKKNLTIEKTIEVLDLTKKQGIIPDGLLIIGDVEDDLETIRETEKFYFENRDKYQLSMGMIFLYPNSPLYRYAVDNNHITDEIKFLEEGCPLVNISKIPDSVYNLLGNKYDSFFQADKMNHAPLRDDSYKLSVSKQGLLILKQDVLGVMRKSHLIILTSEAATILQTKIIVHTVITTFIGPTSTHLIT